MVFVDELIFSDKNRGERRQRDVGEKRFERKWNPQYEPEADKHSESVERVADSLPFRQSAPDVEDPFIEDNGRRLQSEWD